MREYGIDLLRAEMSWRRFRTLYAGLGPDSAVVRNYDRVARKAGVGERNRAAEESAWQTFSGLARPKGA